MVRMKFSYEMDIGRVTFVEESGAITHLTLAEVGTAQEKETPLIREAYQQLTEYLAGTRKVFDLPLAPKGTAFFREAWQALLTIPYGETRSYQQMAEQIGKPKAYRAFGMANSKNPIWIMIPCHRVIGADGKLVGFGGGLDLKQRLLDLEKR